jgi:hypothetical protein
MLASLAFLLCAWTGGHATAHPRDAQVYIEFPDVPAIAKAYPRAPLAMLLADPALRKLLPRSAGEEATAPSLASQLLSALAPDATIDVDATKQVWSALASASASIRGLGADAKENLGVELVLEFHDEAAATRAAEWLDLVLPRAPAVSSSAASAKDAALERSPDIVERSIALPVSGGTPLAVWQARRAERLVFGYGSSSAEAWLARERAPADKEAPRELWSAAPEWTPSSGTTVLRAQLALDAPEIAHDAVTSALLDEALLGFAPFVGSRGCWRVELRGDRFMTEGATTRTHPAPADERVCCERAVSTSVAKLVPASAVGAWIASVRPARIESLLRGVIPAAKEPDETDSARVLPALAPALGANAALSLMPITNLQLLVPPLVLELELQDATAFDAAWPAWSEALLRAQPAWSMQKKNYHDVPLYVFRSTSESEADGGSGLGPLTLGMIQPSIAVFPDRLLITMSPSIARSEIARREKNPDERHALASSKLPDDVVDAGTIDWGGLLGKLYDAARGLLPLIAQNAGSLPFDPAALPPAATWTRYFRPSLAWTRRVGDRYVHYAEYSLGPETPIALAVLAGSVARSFGAKNSSTKPAGEPVPAHAATTASAPMIEQTSTEKSLRDLAVGISVYRSVHGGACPGELAALTQPADGFPRGFLDTQVVPQDGWGRAFSYSRGDDGRSYRLWSLGPDGVDHSGAGDDVRLP